MYTNEMDGLGKFKMPFGKKKDGKKGGLFDIKKSPLMMPLAPFAPAMMLMKKKKKKRVAPVVAEPVTFSPVQKDSEYGPDTGFYPPEYREPLPVFLTKPVRPRPMPQYPSEKSAADISSEFYAGKENIPVEDFFPTELDYTPVDDINNSPMLTPYESAAVSVFGTEEDFIDTPQAWESEAGFLNGLGQESGSTGGWFGDFVSQAGKAAVEIARAKAAAKAARQPAPFFTGGTGYRPAVPAGFGGFDLNKILMFGALGLGGFLLYSKFARKRR